MLMETQYGEGGVHHVSRRYSAPVDTLARIVTIVVAVTIVAAILLFGFMAESYQVVTGLFIAFGALVFPTAYSFQPIAYGMGPEGIVIYFRWRRIRIPWRTIRAVRLEPRRKVFRSIRTLGSFGIFGYLGRYWSPALGFHIRLVTDRSRVVVLFRKVPYCLSPDDPDRFIREARPYLQEEHEEGGLIRRGYRERK